MSNKRIKITVDPHVWDDVAGNAEAEAAVHEFLEILNKAAAMTGNSGPEVFQENLKKLGVTSCDPLDDIDEAEMEELMARVKKPTLRQ